MLKGLNDFLDKHEGREIGSSTKAIMKERKRQGYDKSKSKALSKAKEGKSGYLGKFTSSQMREHGGFPEKYVKKAEKYESKHTPHYASGTEIERAGRERR